MKIYDLIILGAGPAGITAAVYAARKKLDSLVITLDIGGQTAWSGDIENYTGYQFITGPELTLKFQEHMESFGIAVNMPEKVVDLQKEGNLINVTTDKSKHQAKSVIVATGKHPRKLNTEGEDEYKNKGVTYCATCDGPLFKDKPVAIIGGGNSGLDAALQLMNISPKVYIIDVDDKLRADAIMQEKAKAADNVEVLTGTKVKKIYGDTFVSGMQVEKNGEVKDLSVQGVFIEIGLIPNYQFASILECNDSKEIIVDCYNKTNIEGIFAAGDVTSVPEKQIVIACGEGAKATLAAFHYLSTRKW